MLRATILSAACSFGNENALKEAASRFQVWLKNPSMPPHPDIRLIVYVYGMQQMGCEKVWDRVLKIYLAEENAQEKSKIMQALAAVEIPWILQR